MATGSKRVCTSVAKVGHTSCTVALIDRVSPGANSGRAARATRVPSTPNGPDDWNDVFYALFVVGGRLDTLPLNLYQVASAGLYLQNWHLIFAYIILMSLPLLITFMVAQRKIISGITSGAVK